MEDDILSSPTSYFAHERSSIEFTTNNNISQLKETDENLVESEPQTQQTSGETNNNENENQPVNQNKRKRFNGRKMPLVFKPFESFSAIEDTVRELNYYFKHLKE